MSVTVQHLTLRPFRRILVISDIHGGLTALERLLQQVGFSDADALILLGDYVEKGADNLGTLRRVRQLCRLPNVWAVQGNNDMADVKRLQPKHLDRMLNNMRERRENWQCRSLFWDVARQNGWETLFETDPAALQKKLRKFLKEDVAFLKGLPQVLVAEDVCFAHAGLDVDPYRSAPQSRKTCLRAGAFCRSNRLRFSHPLVVGHWPTVIMRDETLCCAPRFFAEQNLFCIDGGNAMDPNGALICLIRDNASGCWSWQAADALPHARALDAQDPVPASLIWNWGNNQAEIVRDDGEFVLCRHTASGRTGEVPARRLYRDTEGKVYVDQMTDELLAVRSGEELSVILPTSRGTLVRRAGQIGWYTGRLELSEE